MLKVLMPVALCLTSTLLTAQQIADRNYNPPIPAPAYSENTGPEVYIDESHHNFHTAKGRYSAFARLLQRDGYKVKRYRSRFTAKNLQDVEILVISNALNKKNLGAWFKPIYPAFTEEEIKVVEQWVKDGGKLFLIADHMPFAGAAGDLAAAFGFTFSDGFALDSGSTAPSVFDISNNTLAKNVISSGRDSSEQLSQVVTFTGQAFRIPTEAKPILTFQGKYYNLQPDTAWIFHASTPAEKIEGWHQGAFMSYGKGKLVVFGEAAMFTAQLAGPDKYKAGMNNEAAAENYQLLLNIIHWLDE